MAKLDIYVPLRVTQEDNAFIQSLASQQGKTRSEVLRELIAFLRTFSPPPTTA